MLSHPFRKPRHFQPFHRTRGKINILLPGCLLRSGFGFVFQDMGVPEAAVPANTECPLCHWSPVTPEAAGMSQRGAGAKPPHSLHPPLLHLAASVCLLLDLCLCSSGSLAPSCDTSVLCLHPEGASVPPQYPEEPLCTSSPITFLFQSALGCDRPWHHFRHCTCPCGTQDECEGMCLIKCLNSPSRSRPDSMPWEAT